MLFVALFQWWYGSGWRDQLTRVGQRLGRMTDYFSITSLVGSLFAPFRQIDAGSVRGSLDVKARAWVDRLVSRFIGAGVRLVLIVVGLVGITLEALVGLIQLVVWPLLPLVPLLGLISWLGNWLPWR